MARSGRGLVRIIGQMAWPREFAPGVKPEGWRFFRRWWKGGLLVYYRAIPGGQGRKRVDGTVERRGFSQKVRERLTTANERRLAAEVLTRRGRHFSHVRAGRASFAAQPRWGWIVSGDVFPG